MQKITPYLSASKPLKSPIVCCFFQASRMNFSQAFFNEEIPHLEKEKSGYESRIKEICGNYYEDPSSPIHQAWIAYQDQKGISNLLWEQAVGLQSLFIQFVIDTGRTDEWKALWQGFNPLLLLSSAEEQQLSAVENFDKRLISYAIHVQHLTKARKKEGDLYDKYQKLENERQQNISSIEETDICLNMIKTSPEYGKRALLLTPLNQHLGNLWAMTPGKEFYHAFKAWANVLFPGDILYAFASQVRQNPAIANKLLPNYQENLFWDAIEQGALTSIEHLQGNFNDFGDPICNFFAYPTEEYITQILLEAIETKHGVRVNLNQN